MKKETEILIIRILDGSATEAEKKLVAEWRKESDANEAYFSDFNKLWFHSAQPVSEPTINVDVEWQKFKNENFSSSKSTGKLITLFSTKALKYAAVVAIGLFVTGLYKFSPNEYHSELEKLNIELADGSNIILNQNTTLTTGWFFNWSDRTMNLDGEAYFDVVKNPNKPFVINSTHANIEVLGTSFNFNTDSKEPKVSVNSGKVAFWGNTKNDAIYLLKGEEGVITDGILKEQKISNTNFESWFTGIFNFEEIDLQNAINQLEAYYDVSLEIENIASVQDCKLTSYFDKNSLEEVLGELEILLNFEIENKHPYYVLSNGSCE